MPAYVQLSLGKTRLLFPGKEVLSLEAVPEIGKPAADGSVGAVSLNQSSLAVYNFDEQLHPHNDVQDGRSACVCLGDGRVAFALLCDKVETVEEEGLQLVELPACMRSAITPVRSLALQGTRILCISCVQRFSGVLAISRGEGASP